MPPLVSQAPPSGFVERIGKPWGYELLVTPSGLPYAAKILWISAGQRLSLQRHTAKNETVVLLDGDATLLLEDGTGVIQECAMTQHVGYTIDAQRVHRLIGNSDCIVMEASTPEVGITERLEDDYGRQNEVRTRRP